MGFFDSIKESLSGSFSKRKEEREKLEELREEARRHQLIAFEEEFRKNSIEAAKIKAKQDAERLSGINKLRAINRAEVLSSPQEQTMFSKLSDYTRKNRARTEQNLKRTELLRKEALKMKMERENKVKAERAIRMRQRGLGYGNGGYIG